MFGLGMSEVLLILALALIVVGPKRLPDLARAIGKGMAEFRRATDDIQRSLYQEAHRPLDPKELQRDLEKARAQTKPGPPPGEPRGPAPTAPPSTDEPGTGS